MDAIGINTVALQPLPTQTSQSAPVSLPKPAAPSLPLGGNTQAAGYDAKVVEQKRFEAVQRMAQDIANVNVLGTTTFTIFKDATGTLVTRFRDNLNGQVKYVPEPALVKLSRSSGSTLRISA